MSVSGICWLHFQGPNDPGEDVLERRGGTRQTAMGRPPSPPPRAALLAVMSSAGKQGRLRSSITGLWWRGGGSPDVPVLWIGSAGEQERRRLFISPFMRANSHSDDCRGHTSLGRGDVLLLPWQPEGQTS